LCILRDLGSESCLIFSLPKEEIFDFAWSKNGEFLALAVVRISETPSCSPIFREILAFCNRFLFFFAHKASDLKDIVDAGEECKEYHDRVNGRQIYAEAGDGG
jgi:hypothetical protein